MPESNTPLCAQVAAEIEELEEEKLLLQIELDAAPAPLQPLYRRELIKLNVALANKRQELRTCQQHQNPPAPRPDLVAVRVIRKLNHATRTMSLAALIRNRGNGNARGPFKIDFGVTYTRAGVTTTIVHVFQVPAGITISGVPVNTQSGALARVGPVIPSSEYVTENMQVPLCYRDEDFGCVYEFEFIVDSDAVVAETTESNNTFYERWWTASPAAARRGAPLVFDSLEAVA